MLRHDQIAVAEQTDVAPGTERTDSDARTPSGGRLAPVEPATRTLEASDTCLTTL
jgi:hypothetical protein